MININKDCIDNSITGIGSNISNCIYNRCYTGMTLLDKYYKIVKKTRSEELPVAAQRDILKLINNKKEVKLQFSIDYFTIEFEDENEHAQHQAVCHVVVKEVLYSYYSMPTINYDTTLPNPIEITCNTARPSITCE